MMDTERRNAEFPTISPTSLKEIALVKISISLFNHKNIPSGDLFDWNGFRGDISKLTKELPFQAELDKYTCQIGNEITNWVLYHADKVLKNRFLSSSLFGVIPCLVWHQNGKINYEKTAESVNMRSTSLNDTIKFKLSVMYGLEDGMIDVLAREDIVSDLLTSRKNKDDIIVKIMSNASSDFKKKILYEHCLRLLFDSRKSLELKTLIDQCCPDPEEVVELKKRLIFSPKAIKELYSRLLDGYWSEINMYINDYLSKQEDKNNLKKLIFSEGKLNEPITFARRMFLQNNISYWESLLLWRFKNTKGIREFKMTLPVSDIFDDLLNWSFLGNGNRFKKEINVSFKPVNTFLSWYFDTPEDIKRYKCRRAQTAGDIPIVKKLFKKNDKKYLKKMILFFGSSIKYNGKIITLI